MDSWQEWSNYCLKELERLGNDGEKIKDKINQLKNELSILKTKQAMMASMWGALSGILAAIITTLLKRLL